MSKISKALRELLLARAAGMIDPEEFARREAELHAELLADKASRRHWWMLGAVVGVVALGIGVYAWKAGESTPPPVDLPPALAAMTALPPAASPTMSGMPSAMPSSMPPAMSGARPGMPMPPQQANAGGDLNTMAVRLAEKLAKNPANGEGWALLGQTYMELRQYKEADQAFAKADALGKVDARLREEWAKAKAQAGKKPAP